MHRAYFYRIHLNIHNCVFYFADDVCNVCRFCWPLVTLCNCESMDSIWTKERSTSSSNISCSIACQIINNRQSTYLFYVKQKVSSNSEKVSVPYVHKTNELSNMSDINILPVPEGAKKNLQNGN